jgi:3-deoxy-D-manno-octulosonic-acid transferase
MRTLYTVLLYLLTPFIILRLLWRSRRAPAYRRRWRERFGDYAPFSDEAVVWIHAVSVGEVLAAVPLLKTLQKNWPDLPLLITTMTPTGAQQVHALFGDSVYHVYLPYDYPGAVQRFLDHFSPRLGIIMETELWPNLLAACATRTLPVVLANARLSARSAQRYQRVASLTRDTLTCLRLIAAQHEDDAQRFRRLGATDVQVTGSLKFDLHVPVELESQARSLRQPWGRRLVWIAASTHDGEEAQVLDAFKRVRQEFSTLLLILVPRHPERFDEVAELCRKRGFSYARRSRQERVESSTAVYLGDTMGELLLLYGCADLAFVGGSLVPTGGHNPLEPAALGVPVLFGPHMFNFADISQRLLTGHAATQVASPGSLARAVNTYLHKPALRHRTGAHGRRFVQTNQGALTRLLALLTPLLPAPEDSVDSHTQDRS